jgi:hypothetical protein
MLTIKEIFGIKYESSVIRLCDRIINYWAGTSKNLGQEGCNTESSYQGSNQRKNPRAELATDEAYSDAKRQRTTRLK